MKKIKSYTVGWDTQHKLGYLSLIDENDKEHPLSKISAEEFAMLLTLLNRKDLYLDRQKWIVSGWQLDP
jgi:hypothetical protein